MNYFELLALLIPYALQQAGFADPAKEAQTFVASLDFDDPVELDEVFDEVLDIAEDHALKTETKVDDYIVNLIKLLKPSDSGEVVIGLFDKWKANKPARQARREARKQKRADRRG